MDIPNDKPISLPDLDLVLVEGGTYEMGDKVGDLDKDSRPVHSVKVTSFYMGKCQVTQHLWENVMGNNPSHFKGKNRPVEQVSWEDAQGFIEKLNSITGKEFRLPTESEWEYAARGGIYSQGYVYAGSDKLRQVGWYRENSKEETHRVGDLLANELGLYDMSGNVWEWCEDDWHGDYKGAPKDSRAWIDSPDRGAFRVLRGGGYFSFAVSCRPAYRHRFRPTSQNGYIGFRLAMSFQSVG